MLVGDVFVLNEVLTINARLINTETGDIVFSKKQEGKTASWLALKTNIAKDISTNLAVAFTSPRMPDIETPFATITSFANAINAKDIGDIAEAGDHMFMQFQCILFMIWNCLIFNPESTMGVSMKGNELNSLR